MIDERLRSYFLDRCFDVFQRNRRLTAQIMTLCRKQPWADNDSYRLRVLSSFRHALHEQSKAYHREMRERWQ